MERKFVWFWEVPKTADNPLQTGFVDNEGRVREEGIGEDIRNTTQKFTREQRIKLNQIKEQAEDVEFEEIQG